jgi:hypothetical protein
MPNQLAPSKKRFTVAEQSGVLAALEALAKSENVTVTDLLRRSARKLIAERSSDPILRKKMRLAADMHAPQTPEVIRTPAKLAKFKREQRQHDDLLQELNLADPDEVQHRNSLVKHPRNIQLTSFA